MEAAARGPDPALNAIRGRIDGAPAETDLHLVLRDAAGDLAAQGAAVVTAGRPDPVTGAFDLPARTHAPLDLVVSAPGFGLARVGRADAPAVVALRQEAKLVCRLTGSGERLEQDALALVQDSAGRTLPIPVLEARSDALGKLVLTRLPAGRLTILVESADSQSHAVATVAVSAGQTLPIELSLTADPAARRRFLQAVGGDAARLAEAAPEEEP